MPAAGLDEWKHYRLLHVGLHRYEWLANLSNKSRDHDVDLVVRDQRDLQGKRRTKSIIWPRQLAMFLFRALLPWSLEEIGAYFGGRDHSTVLHAVKKVRTRAREEEGVQGELSTLLTLVGGGPLDQHLQEGASKKGP